MGKERGAERTCVKTQVLLRLCWKPSSFLANRERVQSQVQSCVSLLSSDVLVLWRVAGALLESCGHTEPLQPCPLLAAHNAHMLAAPLLSYGTINATVDKNRSLLSGAEGWLVSILPSIHCSWITAKESVVISALQCCFSGCWPSYRAHTDFSPEGALPSWIESPITCPVGTIPVYTASVQLTDQ